MSLNYWYSHFLSFKPQDGNFSCPDEIKKQLQERLVEAIYYDEIALTFTRLQTECKDFVASLKQEGLELDQSFTSG